MQKVFSCCEYNKLKILESLLIKRYIVRNIQVLNIMAMKPLTLFHYNEEELKKVRSQLTANTDKLGITRSNESILHEFEKSNDGKVRNNDTRLTLLQAEFENFYDITQEYIKKDAQETYIEYLRKSYNEIAESRCNQQQTWTKVVIGNRKHTKSNPDGTGETSGQARESNPDGTGETSRQVTESNPDGTGETSRQVTESNPDDTGETC